MASTSRQQRLIDGLRAHLGVPEKLVADNELLKTTKGTLTRQLIELELAKEDCAKALKARLDKAVKSIRRAAPRGKS